MTNTKTIDTDTLLLALAALGRGDTRAIAAQYERMSYGTRVAYEDISHTLTALVDAGRAYRTANRNRTVVFGLVVKVDMPATICGYTDRHAATVIAVSPSGHKVTVREDKAIRTDANGVSESQSYTYERDPDGRVRTFYRHGDGRYGKLVLLVRHSYHDYSF